MKNKTLLIVGIVVAATTASGCKNRGPTDRDSNRELLAESLEAWEAVKDEYSDSYTYKISACDNSAVTTVVVEYDEVVSRSYQSGNGYDEAWEENIFNLNTNKHEVASSLLFTNIGKRLDVPARTMEGVFQNCKDEILSGTLGRFDFSTVNRGLFGSCNVLIPATKRTCLKIQHLEFAEQHD